MMATKDLHALVNGMTPVLKELLALRDEQIAALARRVQELERALGLTK